MSVQKETYIIYGIRFGEEFTREYWEKDFYDTMEWDKEKGNKYPFFLSDGMNGDYTFFGFITQTSDGWYDDETESIDLSFDYDFKDIIFKFSQLYPDSDIQETDIKLYHLNHYV